MSDHHPGLGDTGGYGIRTQGHISDRWSDWFEGFDLRHDDDGTTLISSPALDQAALHGLLAKLRDLGIPLISVTRIGPEGEGKPSPSHQTPDPGAVTQPVLKKGATP
jgi:hypothetical protein